MHRQPAPIWDYLRSTLRSHRATGACDERVGPMLDEYLGHLARCVASGEVTLAEGLVLGNAIVAFAGLCSPLPEARYEAR